MTAMNFSGPPRQPLSIDEVVKQIEKLAAVAGHEIPAASSLVLADLSEREVYNLLWLLLQSNHQAGKTDQLRELVGNLILERFKPVGPTGRLTAELLKKIFLQVQEMRARAFIKARGDIFEQAARIVLENALEAADRGKITHLNALAVELSTQYREQVPVSTLQKSYVIACLAILASEIDSSIRESLMADIHNVG
jgi:hypothetical protein